MNLLWRIAIVAAAAAIARVIIADGPEQHAPAKDETPPRAVNKCTRWETVATPSPVITSNGLSVMINTTTHCAEYTNVCTWGRDYTGPKTCERQ